MFVVISFSSFRRTRFQNSESRVRSLAVIVFPAGLDLSGRIETEQQNDQTKTIGVMLIVSSSLAKIAAARMPTRTLSNGLETANQNEISD